MTAAFAAAVLFKGHLTMAEQANVLEQLAAMLQQRASQQPAQPPFNVNMIPAAVMQPMMPMPSYNGAMPQPNGASIPLTLPTPDGREVQVNLHFGPEALANLHGLVAAVMQQFGHLVRARAPYQGGYGGGGGGFYGGGRRNGFYGRRY